MNTVPARAYIDTVGDLPSRLIQVKVDAQIDAIYTRHFRDVYRYVLGLTRSHDEAEDVTAETFERALQAWRQPERVPVAPLPWLLLTSRRVAIDRWRRLRRLVGLQQRVRPVDATAGEARTE